LPGAFGKIHLQHLIPQLTLQLPDLLAEFPLTQVRRGRLPVIDQFQVVTPLVQEPAMNPQLFRQGADVLAPLQPFNRHLPERFRISPYPLP
jgi:hypothetical protein